MVEDSFFSSTAPNYASPEQHNTLAHTWASKSPILGFRGGDTVHKEILEFVLYYIRFDLQGGYSPPALSPPTPTYALATSKPQRSERTEYFFYHLHGQQQLVRFQLPLPSADGDEDRVRPHCPQEVAGGHRRGQEHHVALAQQRGHVRGAEKYKEKKQVGFWPFLCARRFSAASKLKNRYTIRGPFDATRRGPAIHS